MADLIRDSISLEYENGELSCLDVGVIVPAGFNREDHLKHIKAYSEIRKPLRELDPYKKEYSKANEKLYENSDYTELLVVLDGPAREGFRIANEYFKTLLKKSLERDYNVLSYITDQERRVSNFLYMIENNKLTEIFIDDSSLKLAGLVKNSRTLSKAGFTTAKFSEFPGVLRNHENYFNYFYNSQDVALQSIAIFGGNVNFDESVKLHEEAARESGLLIESFRKDSILWHP